MPKETEYININFFLNFISYKRLSFILYDKQNFKMICREDERDRS